MPRVLNDLNAPLTLSIAGFEIVWDVASRRMRFMHAFLDGLWCTFSLSPPPEPEVDLPITRAILNRSDADAIRGDWEAIGNDLRIVMDTFRHEQEQAQQEEDQEAG